MKIIPYQTSQFKLDQHSEIKTLFEEVGKKLLSRFESRIAGVFDPILSADIDFLVSTLEELHQ